jgi:hypothetical protein
MDEEGGTIGVTLALDAAYFHQAKEMVAAVEEADKEFAKWSKFLADANDEAAILDEDPSRQDELHNLCVTIDRHWQSVDISATSLIRGVAVIHMLCAASVEAHINMRAEQTIHGKHWEEFDKLAVTGKWLFYPTLVSRQSFNPGTQPFQGLQTLIKRRNALMHYKVKRAKVRTAYILPPLVDQLGLRAADAKDSIQIVAKLVAELAKLEQRKKRNGLRASSFRCSICRYEPPCYN